MVLDDETGVSLNASVICDLCDEDKKDMWYCLGCSRDIENNAPFAFDGATDEWLCPQHIDALKDSRRPKQRRSRSVIASRRGQVEVGRHGVRMINATSAPPQPQVQAGRGIGKPSNLLELLASEPAANELLSPDELSDMISDDESPGPIGDDGGAGAAAVSPEGDAVVPPTPRARGGGKPVDYRRLLEQAYGPGDDEDGEHVTDGEESGGEESGGEESGGARAYRKGDVVYFKDGRKARVFEDGLLNALAQPCVKLQLLGSGSSNNFTVALESSLQTAPPSTAASVLDTRPSMLLEASAASPGGPSPLTAERATRIANRVIDDVAAQFHGDSSAVFSEEGKARLNEHMRTFLDQNEVWPRHGGGGDATDEDLVRELRSDETLRRMIDGAYTSQLVRTIMMGNNLSSGYDRQTTIGVQDADMGNDLATMGTTRDSVDVLAQRLMATTSPTNEMKAIVDLFRDRPEGKRVFVMLLAYLERIG